ARRMARRVDHLEGAVAEIDHVAGFQDASGGRCLDAVARRVPALRRDDEHLVGGVAVGERPVVARIGEDRRLRPVHAAVRKFVVAAYVVEMRVAGDAGELSLADQRYVSPQAEMAEPAVEEQVAVAPAHMPDVAAEEGLYPRLVD